MQDAAQTCGLHVLSIDGDVRPEDRVRIVQQFNETDEAEVLFLTKGVGAFGLNIASADRVVLFDPHWNPAVDDQAVDRAFRVGQTKNVVCYRFLTVGTVEEKIAERQLRKSGIARMVLQKQMGHTLSNAEYLKDLFTLLPENSRDALYRGLNEHSVSLEESVRGAVGANSEEIIAELHQTLQRRYVRAATDRASLLFDSVSVPSADLFLDEEKDIENALGWIMRTRCQ
jgi:superfamily II DNA/RNA helicase